MFRSRSENLRSIYVLLFANVAMFVLQYQDPERYARLFCFDRDSIVHGHQFWRLFTFQFAQGGGMLVFSPLPKQSSTMRCHVTARLGRGQKNWECPTPRRFLKQRLRRKRRPIQL